VARRLPFAYEMRDRTCARALRRVRGKLKEALYHEPNYVLVPFNGPCVVTVHDLSHIHYPQYHPVERVRHMDKRLPASLARASRVITVSDFVRREVITMLDVKPEKVCTVYNGIDTVFHPRSQEELQPVLERYGLTGSRYLLAVTTLEPRKNLVSLCAAFSRLSDRLKRNHPLIVVGAKGWRTEGIEQAMAPLLQKGEMRWIGYVPADDLPILYAGAHAFVFPSIYEGFGFPPLEAMASGVPVLTSASSALAEVAGDAALLVNPEDIGQLSDGLSRLLTDEEFRKRARAKGLLRAALFTWERCIDETVQVYRSALGLGSV
jgi:alpha-1,3-rhamnosyl/mannosyltransferase